MADEQSPELTQKDLPGWNQIILDGLPCVALLLRPSTREIIASNQAARKIGAVPGAKCFAALGQRDNPCPWCLTPALWETGQPQHLEIEAAGIIWDAHWLPAGPDLYTHYAFDITEHRRAEAALLQSEENYRLVLDQLPAIVFRGYADWSMDFVDRKIEELTGYSKEDFDSRRVKWSDLIPAEDFEAVQQVFHEALKEDRSYAQEHRIKRRDGEIRWVQCRGQIVSNAEGNIEYISGVTFDISARKRMENTLTAEAIRRRVLFEQSKDGIVVLDQNGKVYEANQGFAHMLGYALAEVQQLYVWDWDALWTREQILEMFLRVGAEGERFETVHRRKDGTVFEVEITANWVLLAGQQLGFCVCRDISPRKAAERALRESEERFRVLVEEASDAFFVHDFNGRFYDVNRQACESLGYTREELLHLGVFDLEQDFDLARAQQAWAQIQPGQALTLYGHHRRKDGTAFPVEVHLSVCDIQGQRLFLGLVRDVSEQQQARAALEESLSLYKATLESTADGLLVVNRQGQIVSANQKFRELWRIPEDIVTTRNDDRALAYVLDQLEDPEGFLQKVRELYREPAAESFDVINFKDGRVFERYSIPQYLDTEITGRVWSFRDVTERRRTEEAFKKLVVNAPIGIFIVQNQEIKIVNPGLQAITGYREDELLGKDSQGCVASGCETFVRENVSRMLKGLSSVPFEFQVINKNGEKKWVLESVAPMQHEGEPATLVYLIDISAKKRLEEQLLQAQKMEAVGTLAGGVAHDFNNILTSILGNIGLAMLDDQLGPQVQESLTRAEQACLRAQGLARQLLTFAKGGAPIKKIVSIANLLRNSAILTLSGSKSLCELSIPEGLWSVEADEGQINQVVSNLLINGDQAMPEGGIIRLKAENISVEAEANIPILEGKYVKLTFADQGIGIPSQYLDKIFDPYFTTKQKGSGLGLATAYSIIKNHYGHIRAESRSGVGTTFEVFLPAIEAQASGAHKEPAKPIIGQGKILVMDDDEKVREVLGRMLRKLGYQADAASDGAQALQKFGQAKESGQPFEVVILDLTVPGGMGGKETMEQLLMIDPQITAIVSSGYSDDPIMANFKEYGFSEVLAKPYKVVELSKILRRVIPGKKAD